MSITFSPLVIPKLRDRLAKAQDALTQAVASKEYEPFSSHWATFLSNTGSVLNLLDAGAKVTPQGRQWYGGIKRDGRNNPLVSYLHQARNAEEHGIHDTSKPIVSGVVIGAHGVRTLITHLFTGAEFAADPVGYTRPRVKNLTDSDQPVPLRAAENGATLVPVTDQFGKTYAPPADVTPSSAGSAYLAYLTELVEAAAVMAMDDAPSA